MFAIETIKIRLFQLMMSCSPYTGILALIQKPTQSSPELFGVSAFFAIAALFLIVSAPAYAYILRYRAGRLEDSETELMVYPRLSTERRHTLNV
jgi:hypothetical protein